MTSNRRPLFVATILTGSFLLFLIQPMVARMALPRLGGTPAVWNSAMLVYQALLLGGYWYAHSLSRLAMRRQTQVHLGLLALATLTLPVTLVNLPPPAPGSEVVWVPALLALSIGPVFLLVSAQAPLMQRWFSVQPGAGEPWALYAASNLGSFTGLLAYPLLAEPLLSLRAQSWVWSAGYGLLIVLVALCARARWATAAISPNEPAVASGEPVPRKRIVLWLLLAAVPSGLMLSTTTHLTTDIFAMPLLWVIPLGVYLLSFVLAFAQNRRPARVITTLTWPALLGPGALAMVSQHSAGLLPVLGAILVLLCVCTALHSHLYDLRPGPERLTQFYLVMSAGGVLGGAFTALLAPVVFDWSWEHPILVFAAAALLPLNAFPDWRRLPGLDQGLARFAMVVLTLLCGLLVWQSYEMAIAGDFGWFRWGYAFAIALIGLLLVRHKGPVLLLLVGTMLAQGGVQTVVDTRDGLRTRSYFGIYTVRTNTTDRVRTLAHGTTLHGEQSLDPAKRTQPRTYYGPTSGAGIAFGQAGATYGPQARLAVVGLGTGTLACYARPGMAMTFYEIDPTVLAYSRNGTFTYLSACAPQANVRIGDARLELAKVPAGSIDILAIDAFSSDSIPLHLLTKEAFAIYLRALSQKGVLLVHISNRFIELESVVAATARDQGLAAAIRDDYPPEVGGLTASSWIILSRGQAQLDALGKAVPQAPLRPLGRAAPRAWTDDHASILPHIEWTNMLGRR